MSYIAQNTTSQNSAQRVKVITSERLKQASQYKKGKRRFRLLYSEGAGRPAYTTLERSVRSILLSYSLYKPASQQWWFVRSPAALAKPRYFPCCREADSRAQGPGRWDSRWGGGAEHSAARQDGRPGERT